MHQKTCHDSHSQGCQRPQPVILDVRLPGKNLPMIGRRCKLTGQRSASLRRRKPSIFGTPSGVGPRMGGVVARLLSKSLM